MLNTELNFFGQFHGDLGIPIHSRYFASELIKKVNKVNIIPIFPGDNSKLPIDIKNNLRKPNKDAIGLTFWYPDKASEYAYYKKNILYYIFEYTKIPEKFLQAIDSFDIICTASEWGCNVLKENGVKKHCVVVPGGIDPSIFNSEKLKYTKTYNFLTIGKIENRKGIDLIIKAFDKVFKNNKDARLLLSIDNPHIPVKTEDYVKELSGSDNIEIIHHIKDIRELYNRSNVFVSASKAEGIGLGNIEAMVMGLPVITSDYSGMSTYVSKDRNLVLENLIEEPIFDKYFFPESGKFGSWMTPTVDEIAEKMLWCFNNKNKAVDIGLNAEKWMKENYTWELATNNFISILNTKGE